MDTLKTLICQIIKAFYISKLDCPFKPTRDDVGRVIGRCSVCGDYRFEELE